MEEELKPCPFCGCEAHIEKYCDVCSTEIAFKCKHDKSPNAICAIGEEVFWVEHECNVLSNEEGLYVGCFTSAQAAITAWNTRVERTCTMTKDFHCSECGKLLGTVRNCEMYETEDGRQAWRPLEHEVCDHGNYCPHCGAKVVS